MIVRDSFFLQSLDALDECLDIALKRVTGLGCFDDRPVGFELGPRQLKHIPGLNIGQGAKDRKQFGHIDEPGETRVHSIAATIGSEFGCRYRFGEICSPAFGVTGASAFE